MSGHLATEANPNLFCYKILKPLLQVALAAYLKIKGKQGKQGLHSSELQKAHSGKRCCHP